MNLFLEANNYCEQKCRFCIADNGFINKKCDISTNLIQALIKKYKYEEFKSVFITGGEPLLHPDIFDILKLFADNKYYIYITTNGQLLSLPDFVVRLLSYGINRIAIPVYGSTADRHDEMTGVKGTFNKLIKGLDNLFYIKDKYSPKTKIEIRLLMSAYTIDDNCNIIDMIVKKYPTVDYITLLGLQIPTRCNNYEDMIHISLTEATDGLRKSIDKIRSYGIKAAQTGIPLCILGKEYDYLYDINGHNLSDNNYIKKLVMFPHISVGPYMKSLNECIYREVSSKIKCNDCKQCINYKFCDGLQTRYVVKYGFNDIKPIKVFTED